MKRPYCVNQKITMIRCVERRIGKDRLLFWMGGGRTFVGRAAHMKAMAAARKQAEETAYEP